MNIEVDRMREMSRADFAAGEITEGNLRSHLASCDFCERQDALPVDPATRMDIWGLGEVNVWFVTLETGQYWIPMKQLPGPLGVEPADLYAYYREVRAQGRWLADAIEWIDDGGKTCSIEVVSEYFVSRALLDISPWAELYRESVADLWCHRFIAHGLTDVITDENGRTLTEVIAEKGLPSLEVARHQALSGLSGAVSRLGGQL